ncbi:MAG: AAA family ATPase [Sandaracinaceae bacterium]|nr:AAA family ATPase [Sandaracinaceae bacterium]
MTWPISSHESPDVALTIPGVTAPHYLWAFLMADGEALRADDYDAVRGYIEQAVTDFGPGGVRGQRPTPDVSQSRLRTWKKAFEEMGLLTVEEGNIRATRFGRAVIEGWRAVDALLRGTNKRIARLGAEVANRVLLAEPDGHGRPPRSVPEDADLLPLRAIWRAFRALDDRLHWQDINRVLGHVHYESEVLGAISQIQRFRQNGGDYKDHWAQLGSGSLSSDPRHITPWFNRAGIGGMLIPSEADADGFRRLSHEAALVFDDLLAAPAPRASHSERSDRAAYMRHLMEPVRRTTAPQVNARDQALIDRIVNAAREFGQSKLVVLSGLPGTGKSRAARIAADVLAEGDPTRIKDIQFHESTTYEDFMEGFVPRADGKGFERVPKAFRVMNDRALESPDLVHVLLIEEFTRANVHSVLGELLTFIEHRGRPFSLSLSQDEIVVAPNLIVLATMNPRDKSALTLDYAVVRRMHRIAVPSSPEALRGMLEGSLGDHELNSLTTWYKTHFSLLPFGHGVFAGADSEARLRAIWNATVLPCFLIQQARCSKRFAMPKLRFRFARPPSCETRASPCRARNARYGRA